jgi:hypothetical protein
MSQTYTVIQGDHISRIAEKSGFGNSKPIWGDHNKSDLKEQRDNPYVLKPGDQIIYPAGRTGRRQLRPPKPPGRHIVPLEARIGGFEGISKSVHEDGFVFPAEASFSREPSTVQQSRRQRGQILFSAFPNRLAFRRFGCARIALISSSSRSRTATTGGCLVGMRRTAAHCAAANGSRSATNL